MSKSEIKVIVISNIVFEPYLRLGVEQIFRKYRKDVCLIRIAYEEYASIDTIQKLYGADLLLVALNFEELYPNYFNDIYSKQITPDDIVIDAVYKSSELYLYLKRNSYVPVFWLGFEDYYCKYDIVIGNVILEHAIVDSINNQLNKIISVQDTFLNLKRLIARIGIMNAYDSKEKYRWNAPYSKELVYAICCEIFKQYLIRIGDTKKCIVLDCDNVLWGGILSEDGIDGIQLGNSGLGRVYQDFQRFLVTLYYHGVILTVCSKNDKEDVLNVFREHSGMLLKQEYISCFLCNWDNKPKNVKTIADTLNIGLKSMVFIDDSKFELEAVNDLLPEVTTVLYDRDTIYKELSCFNLKSNIDVTDINKRTETYKTNIQRENLRKKSSSFEEYLISLDMRLDIHNTRSPELARISELTQRTNRCTNGKRCTIEQMREMLDSYEYTLYTVCMKDKFSDLGIVGVMGTYGQTIDVFSLSCRALGRCAEKVMIQYVIERGANNVVFCGTQKNDDLLKLFELYGLTIENINKSNF